MLDDPEEFQYVPPLKLEVRQDSSLDYVVFLAVVFTLMAAFMVWSWFVVGWVLDIVALVRGV